MPRIPLFRASELASGSHRVVAVGKISLGIYNIDGSFYAYRNVCPHAGAPVCEGPVCGTTLPSSVYEYKLGQEGCILRCPWHGWEFDLRTGEHLVDPETRLKRIHIEDVGPDGGAAPDRLEHFRIELDAEQLYVILP